MLCQQRSAYPLTGQPVVTEASIVHSMDPAGGAVFLQNRRSNAIGRSCLQNLLCTMQEAAGDILAIGTLYPGIASQYSCTIRLLYLYRWPWNRQLAQAFRTDSHELAAFIVFINSACGFEPPLYFTLWPKRQALTRIIYLASFYQHWNGLMGTCKRLASSAKFSAAISRPAAIGMAAQVRASSSAL